MEARPVGADRFGFTPPLASSTAVAEGAVDWSAGAHVTAEGRSDQPSEDTDRGADGIDLGVVGLVVLTVCCGPCVLACLHWQCFKRKTKQKLEQAYLHPRVVRAQAWEPYDAEAQFPLIPPRLEAPAEWPEASDRRRREVAEAALRIQREQGGLSGARFLHENITADYWGITWSGFQDFVSSVRAKCASGELQNTGRVSYAPEKFVSSLVGPNMYQVNEQVIMLETKREDLRLPGASWALKASSIGERVTIFVTHAWAEGVFELDRYLTHAWPKCGDERPGAAYICFLSNPQHLDISSMLAEIETSPFNVALRRMPAPGHFIMCPTANEAIHNRLWCVFEAHLALERNLPIIVAGNQLDFAGPENRHAAAKRAMRVAAFAGYLHGATHQCRTLEKSLPRLGAILCACPLLVGLLMLRWPVAAVILFFPVWLTLRCLARRWMRRWAARGLEEAEDSAGDGHLIDVHAAKCTDARDRERILAAISGREDEINRMVGRCIVLAARPEPESTLEALADAGAQMGPLLTHLIRAAQ